MFGGEYKPRLIIRTAIGSKKPLDPRCQHIGDFTNFFKLACKNIEVIKLINPIRFLILTKKL